MKRVVLIFLIASCMLMSAAGYVIAEDYAYRKNMVEEVIVYAQPNEQFDIILDADAATGYQWVIEYDKTSLDLLEQQYIQDDRVGAGTGGQQQYTFIASEEGEMVIEMTYMRWIDDVANKKYVKVVVQPESYLSNEAILDKNVP